MCEEHETRKLYCYSQHCLWYALCLEVQCYDVYMYGGMKPLQELCRHC